MLNTGKSEFMQNKIIIQNFGPIENAEIDLNKSLQVFIGAQASGKSTICKVIYFCEKIRDYTLDYLMDSEQFMQNHQNEYFNNYLKYLTSKFMGCFGTTKHMPQFTIQYLTGDKTITIKLNRDGFVRFTLDSKLKNKICALIDDTSDMYLNKLKNNEVSSIIDNITAVALMKRHLRDTLFLIFESDEEVIYIPAGRSLLATMSEQLHDLSVSDMDLTMQEFINLIRATKSKFGNKIPDMVENYTKTVKGQINNSAVEQAYSLIKKILKADYISDTDAEKIYFDEQHWVKLMFGSSGQQEVLWILMLVFVNILEKKKSLIVIEEPEAHLFPVAQKDVMNLISLMVNVTGSKAIITTHSPYILTSMNILLYSDKVENSLKGEKKTVIPKNFRAAYSEVAAYKVGKFEKSIISLMDEESHMIDTEYIDEVSTITNSELDELLNMEIENDL